MDVFRNFAKMPNNQSESILTCMLVRKEYWYWLYWISSCTIDSPTCYVSIAEVKSLWSQIWIWLRGVSSCNRTADKTEHVLVWILNRKCRHTVWEVPYIWWWNCGWMMGWQNDKMCTVLNSDESINTCHIIRWNLCFYR